MTPVMFFMPSFDPMGAGVGVGAGVGATSNCNGGRRLLDDSNIETEADSRTKGMAIMGTDLVVPFDLVWLVSFVTLFVGSILACIVLLPFQEAGSQPSRPVCCASRPRNPFVPVFSLEELYVSLGATHAYLQGAAIPRKIRCISLPPVARSSGLPVSVQYAVLSGQSRQEISISQDVREWLETIFGRHGAVCLDPSLGEGTAVGVFKSDTAADDSYFFPEESDPIEEYAQGPMQEVEVSAGSIVQQRVGFYVITLAFQGMVQMLVFVFVYCITQTITGQSLIILCVVVILYGVIGIGFPVSLYLFFHENGPQITLQMEQEHRGPRHSIWCTGDSREWYFYDHRTQKSSWKEPSEFLFERRVNTSHLSWFHRQVLTTLFSEYHFLDRQGQNYAVAKFASMSLIATIIWIDIGINHKCGWFTLWLVVGLKLIDAVWFYDAFPLRDTSLSQTQVHNWAHFGSLLCMLLGAILLAVDVSATGTFSLPLAANVVHTIAVLISCVGYLLDRSGAISVLKGTVAKDEVQSNDLEEIELNPLSNSAVPTKTGTPTHESYNKAQSPNSGNITDEKRLTLADLEVPTLVRLPADGRSRQIRVKVI